jgi:hypothetical protein
MAIEDAAERVRSLVAGLGIKYGVEPSFRISAGSLSTNRFLLGFRKQRLGAPAEADGRILELCRQLDMPHDLLLDYQAQLPDSEYVHFGFEQNESACLYKAYLEFFEKVAAGMRRQPANSGPHLMHLGYKWPASRDASPVLTRYSWYPGISANSMLQKVSALMNMRDEDGVQRLMRTLIGAASRRVCAQDMFYMEAIEERNPRHSFDINLYRARLQMAELIPPLADLARRYALPHERFDALSLAIRDSTLGHIAGGTDRTGREFLTIYHGVEYVTPAGVG